MTDVLPFNPEAEEHVVAACLTSSRARETVAELLHPSQVYNGRLARILEECLAAHDRGEPVDQVILAERLTDPQLVQKVRELSASGYTHANVAHHARIVREHATRRDLIRVGQNISRTGWDPPDSLDDALAEAEQAVYELTTQQDTGELRPIRETLDETYETLDRPGGEITGTPTGLHALDTLTAGLQPGNLVVVAARPGMGKSALALNAAHNCAVKHGRPVALFTLEMSAQEINQRLLAIDTHVGLMKIRTRNGLTPDDRQALQQARRRLEPAPLHVDDSVAARITDIRARTRRLHARHPDLALIVVDYLQLMLTDTRDETRNLEVARISRGLKLLARETHVPVMALAQLNRNVEHRHDKKPILSDLRDSGAIEQDADLVIFIHRDPNDQQTEHTAELTVAKHRNGPTGPSQVAWVKQRATFNNLAPEHA